VVKADGYGHGAVAVARAARRAGADVLAVALVEEGVELRDAGIDGPILLLSQPSPATMDDARAADLTLALYTPDGVAAASKVARAGRDPWAVHVKVDTGMHRVGCSPDDLRQMVELVDSEPSLRLEGVWTHCAVADEPAAPFTQTQFDRFEAAIDAAGLGGRPGLVRHAGNSAVGLVHPRGHLDMVRFGIAVYGIAPSAEVASAVALDPVMTLRSAVSHVHTVEPGDGVSYGHRWRAPGRTRVAVVPIGYADGIRRDLSLRGGEVLLHGARRPMVGVVTMDQLMIDCGDLPVAGGDEVVLIGAQGQERITAEEVAGRLDTIPYEVVCAIGARVPRRVVEP
jgi:alanine racemase